jgi:hypothetical protein
MGMSLEERISFLTGEACPFHRLTATADEQVWSITNEPELSKFALLPEMVRLDSILSKTSFDASQ